jgi:hypothetical protein
MPCSRLDGAYGDWIYYFRRNQHTDTVVYIDEFTRDRLTGQRQPKHSCVARLSISIDVIEHVAAACHAACEVWVWRATPAHTTFASNRKS